MTSLRSVALHRVDATTRPGASSPPVRRTSRGSRARRLAWLGEILLIAAFYGAYELSRAVLPTDPSGAYRHATLVMSLERALHVDIEATLNIQLAAHNSLAIAASYYYASLNYVVTPAVLVWLYVKRRSVYRRARTVLAVSSFGAMLVYWQFATAPPRLAALNLADIVAAHNPFGIVDSVSNGGFVNDYAAFPSLHVGWAVWVALALVLANPTWRYRHLFWVYPVTTTYVVVATANHYLLDAVGGLAVVALSALAVRIFRLGCFVLTTLRLHGRSRTISTPRRPSALRPSAVGHRPDRDQQRRRAAATSTGPDRRTALVRPIGPDPTKDSRKESSSCIYS